MGLSQFRDSKEQGTERRDGWMGRSFTPAIIIKAEFVGSQMAATVVGSFNTQREFLRLAGSLEGFIADFNSSTLPDGCNSHLDGLTISKATLVRQGS